MSLLGERGLSATEAAANFLPQTLAGLGAAFLLGPLADRVAPRVVLAGCMGVLAAGLVRIPLVGPSTHRSAAFERDPGGPAETQTAHPPTGGRNPSFGAAGVGVGSRHSWARRQASSAYPSVVTPSRLRSMMQLTVFPILPSSLSVLLQTLIWA